MDGSAAVSWRSAAADSGCANLLRFAVVFAIVAVCVQVAAAAAFMARGLLRHYRLYQHVFSTAQAHTEYTAELMVGWEGRAVGIQERRE